VGGFGGEGDVSPVPNGPTNFVSSTKTIWLLPSTTLKNGGKGQNQKKDTPSALGMIARKREKEGENDLGGCPYRASLFFCAVCYTPLLFTFPPPKTHTPPPSPPPLIEIFAKVIMMMKTGQEGKAEQAGQGQVALNSE